MTKILWCRFMQYFRPLTCWLSISVLVRGFSGNWVNPCFAVHNFRKKITSDSYLFFQSIPNLLEILEMQQKIQKMFFALKIIAFELAALNTRFYSEKTLSSGVNMLTNSLKISDTTKIKHLELTSFQNDKKIWQKYCRADLSCPSDTWTCWLSIIVLIRGFWGI